MPARRPLLSGVCRSRIRPPSRRRRRGVSSLVGRLRQPDNRRARQWALAEGVAEALPEVALNDDVLYDLLLGENLPSHPARSTLPRLHAPGASPTRTRDPRVAERATLAAIYLKQYGGALKSSPAFGRRCVRTMPRAREALAAVFTRARSRPRGARALRKILEVESGRPGLDQACPPGATALGRRIGRKPRRHARSDAGALVACLHPRVASAHLRCASCRTRQRRPRTRRHRRRARAAVATRLGRRRRNSAAAVSSFRRRTRCVRRRFLRRSCKGAPWRDRHAPRLSRVFLIDQKQWEKALEQFSVSSPTSPRTSAIYAP